jgi:hypothetical protein
VEARGLNAGGFFKEFTMAEYEQLMSDAKQLRDRWRCRIADAESITHVVIGETSDDEIGDDADTEIHYDSCEYFTPPCGSCGGTGSSDREGSCVCQSCDGSGDHKEADE